MPEFKRTYVVKLSGLRGVAGCLWSNATKADFLTITFFQLLKVTHVSASDAQDTKLRILLHPVRTGHFLLGVDFIGHGEGQSIR